MKVVADIYGKEPLSREALKMFFLLLRDFSLQQVEQALQAHMRTSPFMPKPSDVIAKINGSAQDRAALAWPCVLEAVRRLGHGHSVAFPTPAHNFAITQMGGWIRLCATLLDEEVKWRGKEFERFFVIGDPVASWEYEPGPAPGPVKTRVERYCVGEYEANNRARGCALPEVLDAVTGKPIPGFREALLAPSLDCRVTHLLQALAGGKRAAS
jgi:hypothetical protein